MITPIDSVAFGSQNDWSDDEPLAMRNLTEQQKNQLAVLLEEYMSALESGLPPSVDTLTRSQPELREPLRACVDGLENLHQLAVGHPIPTRPELTHSDSHRLGDFELQEEIGRGGMGVVYRATQISLRRTVAIKLLPLASILNQQKLARFQHEAEAAACLQHPHIVPIFAVGCERGTHFYAMQYIAGNSLDKVIQQGRTSSQRYDWQTVVSQGIAVAEGLHAAHELGIVHRDIKPSNLIVDREGKVWISDFGLARVQGDVSLTQSGDVIGTMRYMSPEQTRGESALVDGRADVYSLGATLYEVMSGRPVHDGVDAPAILRQIDEDAVVSLRSICRGIPRDLDTVISKAMSKRRDDRYETAQEFADDLRRVLAGEPTVARPPTLLDHCVHYAVRYRGVVAAATAIGLLMIAGFAIGTVLLAAEKSVSDANAARAIQNERIAREAIDGLGTQMAELLAEIPSASSVRQRLLLQTLGYYQRLAAESGLRGTQNREQELDLAITYGKIGSFQGELGQNDEALESLKRSEQLMAELAASDPEDLPLQLQWTVSQNNLAERYASSGDVQSAAVWFGKAIVNQTRISSLDDAGSDERSRTKKLATKELATTLNNLGQMLSETANIDEAETVYQRAIALLQGRTSHSELRSTIQSNLAGLLVKRDPTQAIELAKRSLDRQLQHLEQDRGDAEAATQVVLTLNTLAMAQAEQSRHRDAITSLQRAIEISEQLRVRWPEQPSYRRDLGISLNHLGLSLAAIGQVGQARDAFEAAGEQAGALVEVFADDAEVHSMMGGILNNLGFLNQKLGDVAAAMGYFNEAISHQRLAVELAPQVPRYLTYLHKHETNLKQLRGES
ncbi:serine/threonine-protein kinase [Aporhodopirellula aestuarii]|uniref:Protein kinase n=1 Tax=Aporhodopirellula aestuarii TaxID=2950107 RepID=A0ABT0U060_9BACT|nr:serine/threonine-protein kinase [Aporhodopirellula aestuarii]MCM2369863.1 protein kinase [Aporhodopirellula aestuarii]